jgi:hypothetical protein
MIMVTDYRK